MKKTGLTYREYLYSLDGDEDRLGVKKPENFSVKKSNRAASSFKPSASRINEVEADNSRVRKQPILATGEAIPVPFGRYRFFAKPMIMYTRNDKLFAAYLIGSGLTVGIEDIEKVYVDGIDVEDSQSGLLLASGSNMNTYLGTQGQLPDPMLVNGIPDFEDTYAGYSYLVLRVPNGITVGIPKVEVVVKGAKIRRYDTHTVFQVTGASAGTRNLIPYSADASQWNTFNGATTEVTNLNDGLFEEVRVKSGGSIFALAQFADDLTGVNRYAVTIYYKAGSSGQNFIYLQDKTDSLAIAIWGSVGSEAAQGTGGTVTNLMIEDLGEYYVMRFEFLPTSPGNEFDMSIGPLSSVAGDYVTVYGVQVESADAVTSGTPEFTENPVNVHAYFATLAGETIGASVTEAANWNNEILPSSFGAPRRCFGYVFEKPTELPTLLEFVRGYTGCAVVWDEGNMEYVRYRSSLSSTEFVSNGTFITDISDWVDASVGSSQIQHDTGGDGGRLHLDANADDAIARQQVLNQVDAFSIVVVSAFVAPDSSSSATMKLGLVAGGSEYESVSCPIGQTTQFSVSIAQGASLWIDLVASGTGDVYVDDVSAETVIPDHVFDSDTIKDLKVDRRKSQSIPKRVVVEYIDAANDFRPGKASEKTNDFSLANGSSTSRVSMTGFSDYNCAKREAIERLNSYNISDLLATMTVFDEGLKLQIGDVCSITHPIGLSQKLMFVTSLKETNAGDWTVGLAEWDPLLFSNKVEANPTFEDTSLPIHVKPDPVTGLTLSEELYKRRDGTWDNRVRATWDPSESPYFLQYEVRVKEFGQIVRTSLERQPISLFVSLEENNTYTFEVFALTSLYVSDVASAVITPLGKALIPSDVVNFQGYEVGGDVRLSWDAAVDLDIVGYEIRYGAADVSWEDAFVLDRVDALRYKTKEVSPGTWDFLIKARDSVGQYSENAARYNSLEVTLDDRAYLVSQGFYLDSQAQDLLVHRVKEVRSGPDAIYTNSADETWTALFGAGTLNSFSNPLAGYQTVPGTNFRWESEEYELDVEVSGDFRQISEVQVFAGTITEEMAVKPASGGYTYYTTLSKKTKGKFGKMRLQGLGLAKLFGSRQEYRVDAVTRSEFGEGDTSGASGVTITLSRQYSKVRLINIVVDLDGGSGASFTPVIDNIQLGPSTYSFDVYIFDSADTAVSKHFFWTFEGV